MSVRLVAAVALALALVASPARAEPPKPVLVFQGQPLGQLLGDLKEIVRAAAAPAAGEAVVKSLVKDLQDAVGEKGFVGVDLNRPVAAYVRLREKADDHTVTLVVPVTTEQEFLNLIDRAGGRATPVAGKKGLFTLDLPAELFPHPSHIRIAGDWAYLGFNGDEVADPANLIPAAELIDPKETAQLALRAYPDRVPAKQLKAALDEIQTDVTAFKQFLADDAKHIQKAIDALVDESLKLFRRTAEGLHADASVVTVRFRFDSGTADAATEVVVTPKPGTPLAKDVAARAATTNRFAGVVPADAAVGLVGQLPLFSAEARAVWEAVWGMALVEVLMATPEAANLVTDELFKGLIRSAKAGDGDLAAALCGPNKDGLFTAVAAVACDDAGAIEKALRALAKKLPVQLIAFDADKADGVSIHRAVVPLVGVDADVRKKFGPAAAVSVAFAPKAVYVGFGADAMEKVKAALAAKPGPAAAALLTFNPSRLAKLASPGAGPGGAKFFAALLGTDDKTVPGLTVTLTGGAELTVRLSMNVKHIPRLLANADGTDIDKP